MYLTIWRSPFSLGLLTFLSLCLSVTSMQAQRYQPIHLKIVHTSDVHGRVFDALPKICSYVDSLRGRNDLGVIVTDGGDVLQGHPATYYYNYIDTVAPHIVASTMNRIGYDVATIGNHDIEAGHPTFDRWVRECKFPVLGANAIDTATGYPYFKPYVILERQGLHIAVLGLVTPAIPHWVPQSLWKGIRFDEMVSTARHWMEIIQRNEHPDLVIGLFHSGWDTEKGIRTPNYDEDASRLIAEQVEGFDIILYGHDHQRNLAEVQSPSGRKVTCIAPTNRGMCFGVVDVYFDRDRQGNITNKRIYGRMLDTRTLRYTVEPWFTEQQATVDAYMDEEVAMFESPILERESFFGPSAFISLIHEMQFELAPNAQISLAAPLSYDAIIGPGMTHITDMFKLYKYENLLYTIRLTGRELRDALEMSYDQWVNTMSSPNDHLLQLDSVQNPRGGYRYKLLNMAFNFDAAAGIRYTVDVSKPDGEKVCITSLEDGTPFSLDSTYLVAANSYRAGGGGELFTRGAGIPLEELPQRVIASTARDLRYYLIQLLRQRKTIQPRVNNNWKFVPQEWTIPAAKRDRAILFPKTEESWQH